MFRDSIGRITVPIGVAYGTDPEQVKQILLPKDYVRFKLTGAFATDRAGAAGTLLLDVKTRDWSAELLHALEIPAEWLPPTHEGPQITGAISPEAAQAEIANITVTALTAADQ